MASERRRHAGDGAPAHTVGQHDQEQPPLDACYRALFAQMAEGVFFFAAASGRVTAANPAFQALLGYSEAELRALTLYDFIAHDRASIDANAARIVAEGRNAIGERDYRRKDGTLAPVEVSATALDAAGRPVLVVVVRDLTERRRAEAALHASEVRRQAVVEHVPVLQLTLDRAGVIASAEGQALALLHPTPAHLLGRSIFVDDLELPLLPANARRALAGESFEAIVRVRELAFSVHHAPLRDRRGAMAGATIVAANITRRLRAEAQARRYAAGLTPHEQEVLALLATDLTHRVIAARLNVTYETVRTHLRRIADKLAVAGGRAAIVAHARERGLLDGLP